MWGKLDLIGQTVREFEIQSELGTGGYGAVYRAHDTILERDVAIKIILPQYADNSDFKQRFEAEAKLVAQLEHPHIIPLYSYWQDENGAFLVMRLVRGGSLHELLQIQGALSLSQIKRWLKQLCDALSVAHSADVVHRDLKPDNILLDDLGNAYLTDFGIAKQTNKSSDLTGEGIVGTLAYISPEQIQSQPVSAQSDIYSLGIMLYEMLTGERPFKDTAATKLIMAHLQDPLPSLIDIRPDLPTQLDDFLQVATAKDPDDRYQNTADFFEAFESALKNSLESSSNTQEPGSLPVRLKAETVEERNRQTMLDNVRAFWVEGILEQSLYHAVWLELGMTERTEAVENPWQSVLKVPERPDETLQKGTEIADIFDRMQGKLLILGEPGSGKTTTLLTLARELLNRAEWDLAHPMPVVFNLSSWAKNRKTLAAWMVDELNSKYQVPRKVGQGWLDEEQILPLLDGLDEVAIEVRDACVEAINAYRDEHGFVDVVVCSRIADYEALRNKLRLNGAIVIQALQRDQVDSYLAQAGNDLSAVRKVLEDDEKLRQLTRSPLMLNILTLAYRDMEIDEIAVFDSLEGRRKHLFETYVNRMLERRGTEASYSAEKTKQYLAWLGKSMSKNALSVFHIDELQPNLLRTKLNRGFYLLGIMLLLIFLIVIVGLPLGISLTKALSNWQYSQMKLLPFILPMGVFFGYSIPTILFMVVFTTLYNTSVRIWPFSKVFKKQFDFDLTNMLWYIRLPETIHWRWRTAFTQGTWAASISFLFFFIFLAGGDLVFSGIFALAGFILGGFSVREVDIRTTRAKPNNGIWRSARRTALYIGMIYLYSSMRYLYPSIIYLINPLIPYSSYELELIALGVLAFIGLLFGPILILFSSGGYSVIQHMILRLILSRSENTPLNLAKFLDYASERILLRKVGGGYVFLHRMLLEYFANLDEEDSENKELGERVSRLSDENNSQGISDNIDDMDSELGAQL